jgi:hypothetical protein
LLRTKIRWWRGTFEVQATTTRPRVVVTADGAGVVSHAGSRLLADLADRMTLTGELSATLDGVRGSRPRHDPGRVLAPVIRAPSRLEVDGVVDLWS